MPEKPRKPGPYRPRANPKKGAAKGFFREWRLYRELTQDLAALRAEMSPTSISQIENGEQGLSDRALAALAHAYDCEIGDLFRNPLAPDYELWRIITNLKPAEQEQLLRIAKALKAA